MEIVERVKEIIADYLNENAIELVDIIYRRESSGMALRLLVDKSEGIRLSECEALNNFLSARLDEDLLLDERYILEISSPGLDRPLKNDRDFGRVLGKEIEMDTYSPIDGKRHLVGTLLGMDGESVVIGSGDISAVVPKAMIAMARLKIEI